MFGRTLRAALDAYLELVQAALGCCWQHVPLTVDRKAADEDPSQLHGLLLAGYEQLSFRGSEFALRMAQAFSFEHDPRSRANERWRVAVRQYSYAIELVGSAEEEVVVWHWNPAGDEPRQGRELLPGTEQLSEPERTAISQQSLRRRPHVHIATEQLSG